MQYLVILLDDTAVSFCHYDVPWEKRRPISLQTLRKGIRFAMTENLMIQFVYPDYDLPKNIQEEIETIDHSNIYSASFSQKVKVDVVVLDGWDNIRPIQNAPLVLRTTKKEFFEKYERIKDVLIEVPRVNVVITDVETFSEVDFTEYERVLLDLSDHVKQLCLKGKFPQLNLLTDRLFLRDMNNCGAGDTTITLAPNGKFYVCPAFYYDELVETERKENVGGLELGFGIKNKQLYQIDHAPICRHCDAYQCKRCVWLNRKTTLEVNTPSHEQCVVAHIERKASRKLLLDLRKHGNFFPEQPLIQELDYLDPIEKVKNL